MSFVCFALRTFSCHWWHASEFKGNISFTHSGSYFQLGRPSLFYWPHPWFHCWASCRLFMLVQSIIGWRNTWRMSHLCVNTWWTLTFRRFSSPDRKNNCSSFSVGQTLNVDRDLFEVQMSNWTWSSFCIYLSEAVRSSSWSQFDLQSERWCLFTVFKLQIICFYSNVTYELTAVTPTWCKGQAFQYSPMKLSCYPLSWDD